MDIKHILGKSAIFESEKENEVKVILDFLKSKKQTYAVNKFVLEETIQALKDEVL